MSDLTSKTRAKNAARPTPGLGRPTTGRSSAASSAAPGLPRFLQRATLRGRVVDPSPDAEREAESRAAAITPHFDASARPSGTLLEQVRPPMERQLGADLSSVRVHANARAEQLNETLAARAFTTGNDIFARPGELTHDPRAGRQLLAHELTHVAQQRAIPSAPAVIQRQPMDAGVIEAPAVRDAGASDESGVPLPTPAPTPAVCPDPLPEFDHRTAYVFAGNRFDARYGPTAPAPNVDPLTITHRIHISFLPFSTRLITEQPRLFGKYRGVRFTAAQRAEFSWDDTEKEAFQNDFRTNVQSAWSARHTLVTNEPCFATYRASVAVGVEFVDDPARAHSTITAYKMPPDSARLRSEVSGSSATLESRDPSVEQRIWSMPADFVRQVGPFEFDKADVSPDVQGDINEVAALLRPHLNPSDPDSPLGDSCLSLRGRASSEGSESYNRELARRRVITVRDQLHDTLGVPRPSVWLFVGNEPGESNATTDERFRRVDVSFSADCPPGSEKPQNVAAHEFGHLIGLGDEYVDERPPSGGLPKFEGDRPTHFGDVEAALGAETANELLVQSSGSIMASGSEVRRGHYVYFLNAIARVTGKSWTVE